MSFSYNPWGNDGEADGSTYTSIPTSILTSIPEVTNSSDVDNYNPDNEVTPLNSNVIDQTKLFEPLLTYFKYKSKISSDLNKITTYCESAQLIDNIINSLKNKKTDVSAIDVIKQICKEQV